MSRKYMENIHVKNKFGIKNERMSKFWWKLERKTFPSFCCKEPKNSLLVPELVPVSIRKESAMDAY